MITFCVELLYPILNLPYCKLTPSWGPKLRSYYKAYVKYGGDLIVTSIAYLGVKSNKM